MSTSANSGPTQSSFQRVIRDVLDLCELQMQLISVDGQAAKRKLVHAVVCGAVAIGLAGSALTVAMLAAGFLLGEFTDLTTGGAMLIVSVTFFVIVAVFGWIALRSVLAAAAAMSEAKSEFSENLRWIKATLVAPETSARNQLRRDSFDDRSSVSYGDTRRQNAPPENPFNRR